MIYEFAEFRLDPGARRLLREQEAIPLTPKEFQTLLLLVEAQGRALERESMIQSIWPDTVVGDTSLGRNISVLRKHLGSEAIEAVPRFGYRFGLRVTACNDSPPAAAPAATPPAEERTSPKAAPDAEEAPTRQESTPWPFWKRGSSTAAGRLLALVLTALLLGLAAMNAPKRWFPKTDAALKTPPSGPVRLAVLPFRNTSANPSATDYLRDGIADELTARLGELNLKHLQVIARSTTSQYADTTLPADRIGDETGAAYLLEGSVRFDAGQAHVTASLVDANTQAVLWSQVLERPVRDLSAIQEELANRIAANPAFAGEREAQRSADGGNVLPEAHDEYLRGRFELGQARRDSYQRALTHFEQAVKLDPGYAKGYAGIAEAYIYMTDSLPLSFCYAKAHDAVLAALQLDDSLSDAHRDLGWLQMYERNDPAGSEAEFRRALELNPDDARAHLWYASMLTDRQRYREAVQQANAGYQLDPRSAPSAANDGYMLVQAGDLERGKQMIEAALKLDPGYEAAWGYLGMVYLRMHNFQQAAAAYDHAASFSSFNAGYLADAAYARAKAGDPSDARKLLQVLTHRVERREYFPAEAMAMTQAALGNKAQTAEWLRKAVQDNSVTVFELSHDPYYSEMKDQPGFPSLPATPAHSQ